MPRTVLPLAFSGRHAQPSHAQTGPLTDFLQAVDAPPDRAGLGLVLQGAALAVRSFLDSRSRHAKPLEPFASKLGELARLMAAAVDPLDRLAIRARERTHAAWALCSHVSNECAPELLNAVGAEIFLAILLKRRFRPSLADLLLARLLHNDTHERVTYRLRRLSHQLDRQVALAQDASDQVARDQLLVVERCTASLIGDLRQPATTRHDGVDTVAMLTQPELSDAARNLHAAAAAGDPVAVLIVIAFCLGLPWELALDVPFSWCVKTIWVARIDVKEGITEIDIDQALPELSKARDGHVPTTTIVRRPLPPFAASSLRELFANRPSAMCLRQLVDGKLPHARSPVPGTPTDLTIKVSIARLIRSRGISALWAGADRNVACFAAMDLTLQVESKYHYLSVPNDILQVAVHQHYASLGWDVPVAITAQQSGTTGSRVTPEFGVIRDLDATLLAAVEAHRVGRRYDVHGLCAFHSTYSLLCASRVALFTSARAAAEYKFLSDTFKADARWLSLVDKRVAHARDVADIPIPVALRNQLQLYSEHLDAFHERLLRLDSPLCPILRRHIGWVLNAKRVPLFFTVEDGHIRAIGSDDVLRHASADLKGDAYRHLMTNALAMHGVSAYEVDVAQRRVGASRTSRRESQLASRHAVFARLAKAMDKVAMDLDIRPVKGIRA